MAFLVQTGFECNAGKANQYVNLYFLRSAKEIMMNDARSEGIEKIVLSFMASHIYGKISQKYRKKNF